MSTQILVNGQVRSLTSEQMVFERKISLAGSASTVHEQRRQLHVGTPVTVRGRCGTFSRTILAISVDGLSWKDEDGLEHLTASILI
jgi:hypothetical protein